MSEPETLLTFGDDQAFITELQSISLHDNGIETELGSESKQSDIYERRGTHEYKQAIKDGKNAEQSTTAAGTNYQEPMVKRENNKNDVSETTDCEKSVSHENDINSRFVTKNDNRMSDDFVIQEMVDGRKDILEMETCLNGSKEINSEETMLDDKTYCNIILNNGNNPIGSFGTLKDTQNTMSIVNQFTENVTDDSHTQMNEIINVKTEKENYGPHVAPTVEGFQIENSSETMGSAISTNNDTVVDNFKEIDGNIKKEDGRDLREGTEMELDSSNLNVTEIQNKNNEEDEESTLPNKPQLVDPQEEDNESTIGMSPEEELEIRMIIEMAEREYAKDVNKENENDFQQNRAYPFEEGETAGTEYVTSDYVQLENDSGYGKVGFVYNNDMEVTDDKDLNKERNSNIQKWNKTQRTSRYKWVRGQDTASSPPQPGQAQQVEATSENEEMNSSTGNSSGVNLDDKELIMELVAIALGEKTVPPDYQHQVPSRDRRGQIISQFVQEYFDKLKSKPKQCNSRFCNQSQVNVPDNFQLKAPNTKTMNFSEETYKQPYKVNKIPSLKTKDRLNTFRSDFIPVTKSKAGRESRCVEAEDTPIGNKCMSLKWEFDGDKVVYKPVGGGFERKPEESDDKKSKTQRKNVRKRACSWSQLPMNDRNGDFYLDRSLVPVDLYQEGLDEYHWNPTMVVNEICSKSDWPRALYLDIDYNDKGYLASVTVKGKEFHAYRRGKNKNMAKHFASKRFLAYLGFRFVYDPYPDHSMVPSRSRSASATTEDYRPRRAHSQSSPSKSRRCHTSRRSRSASWESDQSISSYGGRRSRDESPSEFCRIGSHKSRLPSPPMAVLDTRRRERPSRDRECSPSHHREHAPKHHQKDLPTHHWEHVPKHHQKDLPTHHWEHAPKHHQKDLPTHHWEHVPKHHQKNLPSHNREHLPEHHQKDLPSHNREQSPKHHQKDLPSHSREHSPERHESNRSKSSGRPPKWDRLDEIPSFVPQRSVSPPGYRHPFHQAVPPQPLAQHKCRCKLSFPHPSVHPWWYMLKGNKKSSE